MVCYVSPTRPAGTRRGHRFPGTALFVIERAWPRRMPVPTPGAIGDDWRDVVKKDHTLAGTGSRSGPGCSGSDQARLPVLQRAAQAVQRCWFGAVPDVHGAPSFSGGRSYTRLSGLSRLVCARQLIFTGAGSRSRTAGAHRAWKSAWRSARGESQLQRLGVPDRLLQEASGVRRIT